jgi:hypothetical protein
MSTRFEHDMHLETESLADLKDQAAELERKLSDVRESLERQMTFTDDDQRSPAGRYRQASRGGPDDGYEYLDPDRIPDFYPHRPGPPHSHPAGQRRPAEARTQKLVDHGRSTSYSPGLSFGRKAAVGTAVIAVLAIVIGIVLTRGGPGWPASVATVRTEITKACQNPDVKSEPNQVNFACASSTSQILWVFALLMSNDNPGYADVKTGRIGLEPITPGQGGEIAWSLNLHSPYNPYHPIDSLAVAARAINNIIGGATVTGSNGNAIVQPGLESHSANCLRYTGSSKLTTHAGFPALCAKPITTPAGQAALVSDVYQKWVVGAAPQTAQDAATLFENADNPGDPGVQAILKHLPDPKLLG